MRCVKSGIDEGEGRASPMKYPPFVFFALQVDPCNMPGLGFLTVGNREIETQLVLIQNFQGASAGDSCSSLASMRAGDARPGKSGNGWAGHRPEKSCCSRLA